MKTKRFASPKSISERSLISLVIQTIIFFGLLILLLLKDTLLVKYESFAGLLSRGSFAIGICFAVSLFQLFVWIYEHLKKKYMGDMGLTISEDAEDIMFLVKAVLYSGVAYYIWYARRDLLFEQQYAWIGYVARGAWFLLWMRSFQYGFGSFFVIYTLIKRKVSARDVE